LKGIWRYRSANALACLCLFAWVPRVQSQEARQETLENLRTEKTDAAKAGRRVLHLGQNEDIGVLELVSRETPPPLIAVGTEQAFFYTDNVLLTETERIKSIGF
jgi:hypothetical protein